MSARAFNTTETLADGGVVRIHFLSPNDKDGLVALFDRLSPNTIHRQLFQPGWSEHRSYVRKRTFPNQSTGHF
jgi:hypothetical protein